MAEFNYWQELGLDPLWVERDQRQRAPAPSASVTVSKRPPDLPEPSNMQAVIESSHPPVAALADVAELADAQQEVVEAEVIAIADAAASEPIQPPAAVIEVLTPSIPVNVATNAPVAETLPEPAFSKANLSANENAIDTLDWEPLEDQIHACKNCELHCTRTQAVPGTGLRRASWMVIGEAPGADEDKQGEPFVGQAGKLLDAMLGSIGRSRQENVYIANVLKCRPPNNRKPEPQEVAACIPYLHRQLALVQPDVLLAVGATAAQALLNTDAPIGRLRGTVHEYRGKPLIVTYHPAYLLRSPMEKAKAWVDLCLLQKVAKNLSDMD